MYTPPLAKQKHTMKYLLTPNTLYIYDISIHVQVYKVQLSGRYGTPLLPLRFPLFLSVPAFPPGTFNYMRFRTGKVFPAFSPDISGLPVELLLCYSLYRNIRCKYFYNATLVLLLSRILRRCTF